MHVQQFETLNWSKRIKVLQEVIINENILKIFIHEITDVSKITNCIWRVIFNSMGISSQEAIQQSIVNIRLLNRKIYPQNILLDKITSEMINSLTSSGGYYKTGYITHKSFITSGPIHRISIIQGNLDFKIPVMLKTEHGKSSSLLFKVNKLS
jgi:hypothetical protein